MSSSQRFVANHVAGLPKSGIRDFFAIVSQMKDAISLGIGEPDFVTPWHIREAAIYALEKGKTSYTDNKGLITLRREISSYVERFFGISYNPENEILVAVGVSEALDIALRAILNPGEKVIYHEPCYVSYSPSIKLCHAEAIPVATSADDDFAIDPDKLIAAWEPGVKAILLNFPTNPTGGVTERAKLERIAKFAVEKDIVVLADEIYAELTYDGEHVSIASFPGMKERTIFLHGFSKAFAMTGFRIGYACSTPELVEAMMKVHQYAMMCAPILSQEAAIEALKNGEESVLMMKDKYQQRRDFITRRFNEIGLKCHVPNATFYAFPSLQGTGLSSMDFCQQLLKAEKVAVVPGTAFGPSGEGFFRASFSNSYEQLIRATDAIERFVGTLEPAEAAAK
ncbi:aminotransferase class I/II-fold pyridoxal phosphate-dependent enzyme [Cerasicoccus maritimus]|uniref:aminotransferase class I/II-fold pyridoxal phosphate-dependent enzyme n=1 Tax=Cerasicoccus maritimus TaxID=490089 RepID=UPI0028528FC5|nr:aminotransferase class I/II-fold pyridoxal phosphate-dependent enzyme [Cerasicoccus maritimus]